MDTSSDHAQDGNPQETNRLGFDGWGTAWNLLSSPLTLALSIVLLASLLLIATQVPQGLSGAALLKDQSFSLATLFDDIGVNDVWVGWISLLLMTLTGLSLIGVSLRYGLLPRRNARTYVATERFNGPMVSRAEGSVKMKGDALKAVIERLMPLDTKTLPPELKISRWSQKKGWVEGTLCCLVATLVLIAGLVIDRSTQFDARIHLVTTSPSTNIKTEVRSEGRWVEKKLPFAARCNPADPADPTRKRSCQLAKAIPDADVCAQLKACCEAGSGCPPLPGQASTCRKRLQARIAKLGAKRPDACRANDYWTFEMAAGESIYVEGLQIELQSETPIPYIVERDSGGNVTNQISARLLITRTVAEATSREVLNGNSGTTYALNNKVQVTPVVGPDGAVVVVSDGDNVPVVMVPSARPEPSETTGLSLSSIPHWRTTLRATADNAQLMHWISLGFLLLGLILLVTRKHLIITAYHREDGEHQIVVHSYNRSALPKQILSHIQSNGESS